MKTRSGLMLTMAAAAGLTAATADAQEVPRRHTYYIAPGNPQTVGRNGAVDGVVPHQAVPAPHGAMSTFGGLLGTGAPRSAGPAANVPANTAAAPR